MFLFFLAVFKKKCSIALLIENTKLRLVLVLPTGTSITVGNQADEPPQITVDKTNDVVSKKLNAATYLLDVLLTVSLWQISKIK